MPPFSCESIMSEKVRIATRESQLAMWQAHYVKSALEAAHPDLEVEILGMTTQGDRDKNTPLARLGGKGVFVKELELALLEDRADIAVHSMKDVPAEMPDGLDIVAICQREDPRDAFVSNHYASFEALPAGARVGSSSLRRRLQMQLRRPELEYADVRGNLDTRLRKLDEGEFDAIILAVAGLKRLGLAARITEPMATDVSTPSAGQGAVGIEARTTDGRVLGLLAAINDQDTFDCVMAERVISTELGASCDLPVAAFAVLNGAEMNLQAYVGNAGNNTGAATHIRKAASAARTENLQLAKSVAAQLLDAGAAELLAK
jgi:hydroxymethylbilane synthase